MNVTKPRLDWYFDDYPRPLSMEVDDVRLVQPVGFIWHSKPRYRVKAMAKRESDHV